MEKKDGEAPVLEFSAKYDKSHAREYFEKHNRGIVRKISNLRDHQVGRKALILAGNPLSVLDVPCGTGRFWDLLAEEPRRKIYASDHSQEMLNTGLEFRPPEITSRVESFRASAFELPVEDNFVETVFCIRLIHHIGVREDRLRLLQEFHRVCSKSVIISLWVGGNIKGWKRKRSEMRRAKHSYQNRFVFPAKSIEEEFKEAGFRITAKLDSIPWYSMWRTYVLEKCPVKL